MVDEKPTLRTISQLSGLAVPTVSRALNDAPDISQSTKELVRRIAHEIGYIPNRAGVRLRTGRTNVISIVMPTTHDMMNNSARLVSSVAASLRDTNYHLIVTPFFPDDDPLKAVRYIVESGSADAIILNQIEPDDPRVAYLQEQKFPFVTHGRTKWSDSHPYYDFDNTIVGQIAADRLHKRGRKVLAFLAPPLVQTYAQHMLEGLQSRCRVHGQTLLLIEPTTADSPADEIVHAVQNLFDQHPDIDGIVCPSTWSALAVVAAIEARELRVGQDVDVHTKEASPFLRLFRREILTISESFEVAGQCLAQAAIHAIQQPSALPLQRLDVPNMD